MRVGSARDVRALPTRIGDLVFHRLTRLGVATSLINSERRVMTPVRIGPMVDRSVLGIMLDFGKGVPYHLAQAGGAMHLFPRPKIDSPKHRVTQGCHGACRVPGEEGARTATRCKMGWLTGG